MAKQQNMEPRSANLSSTQMSAGLTRLEKRRADLIAFDPNGITHNMDPKIQSIENLIDDFLVKAFGEGTIEHNRYSRVGGIDHVRVQVLGGAYRVPTLGEVQTELARGKAEWLLMLDDIERMWREEIELTEATQVAIPNSEEHALVSREVFVVHGTDHGTRAMVARFLEQLDLEPIILDEQANKGRTIHQKFRDHSGVRYAVVLFTPDDIGAPADNSKLMAPRPRQNVVYELGFFSAKLGDSNVCVLYSEGVEIPSDMSGVIYIPLDKGEAWHLKLAKEIKACGIDLDMNKAVG